ncbi:CmpA/NrtA family ABC transporter substrate-binding protein [Aurantimonas sp. VKM B-3413]|uniref:CmpA/NrtA family ABC transporter substrate-binding protein n=1 Tax=Aurantimonas sp. VKM B-3413 TaxID=2779401 RepID=UPI001E38328D|nr:CmpA/NrtA family ABC transporter substrate-binding protein [Aurantimonas sp. VKM B-3413]MCB8838893.1 ABC transporter substrate-binding protein [Aurantimonas sp. VKM B-3413]
MSRTIEIRAGFLPLLDSAVLVAAAQEGFAEARGIHLKLSRETSWATIRDRMGVGHFDVAHMLAPMPIAASLGIGPLAVPMIAPMVLALGGNAVTVSQAVAATMETVRPLGSGPADAGAALRTVVERRKAKGEPPLRFAVVHPHSSHNYDLRYWLAASGIAPERDVDITVVPPPLVPDALAGGQIDGFCVGEPWSTIAVRRSAGAIVTTKAEIWRRSPEKVLGVARGFAEERPDALERLILALADAAAWCDDPANHLALAALLAAPENLGLAETNLLPALAGRLEVSPGRHLVIPDFIVFHASGANRPDPRQGRWLLRQMVRWGDAPLSPESLAVAGDVFRPDLYRQALGEGPEANSEASGSSDVADGPDVPPGLFDREAGVADA